MLARLTAEGFVGFDHVLHLEYVWNAEGEFLHYIQDDGDGEGLVIMVPTPAEAQSLKLADNVASFFKPLRKVLFQPPTIH